MKKQWIVTIIVACIVGVASYAATGVLYSRQAAGRVASGMGQGMTPVIGYLGLTPEQRKRVEPMAARFQETQQAACSEMQDARARLLDVLRQPVTSQSELDAALEDVSLAQARIQRQSAEYMLEIKPVLTDAQKDRLFGLVGQRFCGQGRCGGGICPANGGPGRRGRCGRM